MLNALGGARAGFCFFLCFLCAPTLGRPRNHAASPPPASRSETPSPVATGTDGGILFSNCPTDAKEALLRELPSYFSENGIDKSWYSLDSLSGGLNVALNTPKHDTGTLDLCEREKYGIVSLSETYKGESGNVRIRIPSKKEILLAMMQHGRTSEFENAFCSVAALNEHIEIRQNTVRWGKTAEWEFAEYRKVVKNTKLWNESVLDWTVKPGTKAEDAVLDMFLGDDNYKLGCTKAVDAIEAQGPIDHFMRKCQTPIKVAAMRRLMGNEPVNDVEDKYLKKVHGVDPRNWIPGDWGWIRNTHEKSSDMKGFEGSNIVYGGCGGFIGYYKNNPASRPLESKVARVYNWRFLAPGEEESNREVSSELLETLVKDPSENGLLRHVRLFPKNFFPELQGPSQNSAPMLAAGEDQSPTSSAVGFDTSQSAIRAKQLALKFDLLFRTLYSIELSGTDSNFRQRINTLRKTEGQKLIAFEKEAQAIALEIERLSTVNDTTASKFNKRMNALDEAVASQDKFIVDTIRSASRNTSQSTSTYAANSTPRATQTYQNSPSRNTRTREPGVNPYGYVLEGKWYRTIQDAQAANPNDRIEGTGVILRGWRPGG